MLRKFLLVLTLCWHSPPAASQALVTGPNVRVSEQRGDIVQVEPVIAADPSDPRHMVAAAIGLRRPHASDWQDQQTILVYSSEDAGQTWAPRAVGSLPDGWTAGDPWLAWLSGDHVVLSGIAGATITRRGEPAARARTFWSDDRGVTWLVGGRTSFLPSSSEDHPVLAVDPRSKALYAVATHATSREEGVDVVRIARSSAEIEQLQPLRPDLEQVNLGGAVVGLDGALVVTFFSMRSPRSFWSARLDGRRGVWSVARIREAILPTGFPSLTVDTTSSQFAGRIYAAWVEGEDQMDLRVLSAWSDDGGRTWSEPVRVHSDIMGTVRSLPVISVATDGAVGVVWQDRRHAAARDCSDLYGAISTDGGATYLPEVRISSETSCPETEGNGAAAARFRLGGGDYEGLIGTGPGAFQAIWADSRTGKYQVWTAWLKTR
jgi:hypothetical protein